ncbi:histidine phosphatase family protein [Paenibacillus sp. N3/727]|uniref:histidine phosphatase family protein n=1 Tax=Paenibacillus sp. N3/727 TaxID=2925845 RepID=UPI001F533089|nr:histidine phosphatase family protein [Paenibacillus sp. N3/727]UNK19234.1 histidine phosphatase family protein [Paenibacillus sp. N3/727]
MELFLVRHGQSVGNTQPDRDMPDSPLTEQGHAQAARVAIYLRERGIRAIYASPLIRAMQSAQPLARLLGLPIHVMKALYEVREGSRFIGLSQQSLLESVPEAIFEDTMETDGWECLGGDRPETVGRRAQEALRQLRACREERIAVFCHGNFNEYLLRETLGIPSAAHIRFPQENTGVNHIVFGEEETELLKLNDTGHLRIGEYERAGLAAGSFRSG